MALLWIDSREQFDDIKVLYLGERIKVPRVIDQYEWAQIPRSLNLLYYETLILELRSLSDSPKMSLPSKEKMFQFLFSSGCREVIAFGDPGNEVVNEGFAETSVSWWFPSKVNTFRGNSEIKKCKRKEYRSYLDGVGKSDWRVSFKNLFEADSRASLQVVHPLTKCWVYSPEIIAEDSLGKVGAFSVQLSLVRTDGHVKDSGVVSFLPYSEKDSLFLIERFVKEKFKKLIRTAPADLKE